MRFNKTISPTLAFFAATAMTFALTACSKATPEASPAEEDFASPKFASSCGVLMSKIEAAFPIGADILNFKNRDIIPKLAELRSLEDFAGTLLDGAQFLNDAEIEAIDDLKLTVYMLIPQIGSFDKEPNLVATASWEGQTENLQGLCESAQ
jgi:hypothetical protein